LQYKPAHETFIYKHWDHDDTWRDVLAGKPAGMSMSIMTMLDPNLAPEIRKRSPLAIVWNHFDHALAKFITDGLCEEPH